MIENGIIKLDNIFNVPFKVDLIPKENKSSRPALPMQPTSITVHETGNVEESADARSHTNYVDNTKRYVSWHFTIDDNVIIQELPIIENAWHAGDGSKGPGNRTSIAVEICVNKGGDFEKAKNNAAKLIYYLKQHVGTVQFVTTHSKWIKTDCPHNILKSGWNNFLARIDNVYNVIQQEKKIYPVPDWAKESWKWAVEKGINDGIVQSPLEVQFTHMLFKYNKARKEGRL